MVVKHSTTGRHSSIVFLWADSTLQNPAITIVYGGGWKLDLLMGTRSLYGGGIANHM